MGGPVPAEHLILQRLGIALCLGLFLGLEREYSQLLDHKQRAAGLRTHTLVALLGAATGLLGMLTAPTVLAVIFGLLAALVVAGYVIRWERVEQGGLGMTSEVALLFTFVLGALVMHGQIRVAVVAAGAANVVLSAKAPLHRFVTALRPEDWAASMKLAVITLVVLPVLPNAGYGPYDAFNPYKVWLMVVLIGGISFFGYVMTKVIGAERGVALTGLIGGLASSTAVTLSNARRSRTDPDLASPLALSTVLACAVMLPRLLLIVAALHPPLAQSLAMPYTCMLVVSLGCAGVMYRQEQRRQAAQAQGSAQHSNPFELHSALKFAVIFAVVTLLVKWVRSTGLGQGGFYLVSFLAGLVEMDAIVVALAQQARAAASSLGLSEITKALVLAAIGNSLLKAGLAIFLGGWRHGRQVLGALGVTALIGVLVVWRLS